MSLPVEFPAEILNPDSLAEVLAANHVVSQVPVTRLVETLLLFIPLDRYENLLRECQVLYGERQFNACVDACVEAAKE